MEELRTVGNEANFWQQMYDEASKRRRHEQNRAAHYQKRAETAEKALAKLRKGIALVGVTVLAAANGVYWIIVLLGR